MSDEIMPVLLGLTVIIGCIVYVWHVEKKSTERVPDDRQENGPFER